MAYNKCCTDESMFHRRNSFSKLMLLVVFRETFYISTTMATNAEVVDIGAGQGNPGDFLMMNVRVTGNISQLWYFDAQRNIRSAKNDYAIDKSS